MRAALIADRLGRKNDPRNELLSWIIRQRSDKDAILRDLQRNFSSAFSDAAADDFQAGLKTEQDVSLHRSAQTLSFKLKKKK